MEAFEKELNDSKAKSSTSTPAGEDDDDDDDVQPNTAHLDVDDAGLDEDPFAQPGDAPVGVDAGTEPWLKSDRDYAYPEARRSIASCFCF